MKMRGTRASTSFVSPKWLCHALSVSLGLTCLLRAPSSVAFCNNVTPSSAQTTTCDTSAPNPAITSVQALAGSTGVTVIVEPRAGLSIVSGNGILVRDLSTVINMGTVSVANDTFDGISSQGSGAGQNQLINRGTISTTAQLILQHVTLDDLKAYRASHSTIPARWLGASACVSTALSKQWARSGSPTRA
jgi:hypothetical protein